MKSVYIAEKPSVAQEFAKALKLNTSRRDGYLEGDDAIVTWCVGHLITMSYPDAYDPALKRWSMDTLPFLPETFRYEVIEGVKKQFGIVKGLLTRSDVDVIYVCTDSGREGEYIYRLVDQEANVTGKQKKRVWIDSQTEEEILRGIREAKDLSEYDNLGTAAYLRAKEDYLMGINFSRLLTLKYGRTIASYMRRDKNVVIAVGRVMTCVLGMIVRREREIREFVKTPFYRVLALLSSGGRTCEAEWKAVEGSAYDQSPLLYKDNGFRKEENARELIALCRKTEPFEAVVRSIERKKEKKNPPLLYNLAELQNDCSRLFKISPAETLQIVQELYEKKMVTYPRTDARVLSTAVSKELYRNVKGLTGFAPLAGAAAHVLETGAYRGIARTRYVNDKQITDHYAIIPTGQGLGALRSVSATAQKIYELIGRRFLSIFYPPAVYEKVSLTAAIGAECFFASIKTLETEGYLSVARPAYGKETEEKDEKKAGPELAAMLRRLKKGSRLDIDDLVIREGETSPPKRYNSGSMILAMENAGQLIEDEELRAQIKGSGIGTSATRAEIIKKLVNNSYITLNKKTQILTPTAMGEYIFDVVNCSIRSLLNPELTASWEKGLAYVEEGTVTEKEYMEKLEKFICDRTERVRGLQNQSRLIALFKAVPGRGSDGRKK